MNRDGLRTFVAIVVIAAMVLLAVGAVGASLLDGSADASTEAQLDATGRWRLPTHDRVSWPVA